MRMTIAVGSDARDGKFVRYRRKVLMDETDGRH